VKSNAIIVIELMIKFILLRKENNLHFSKRINPINNFYMKTISFRKKIEKICLFYLLLDLVLGIYLFSIFSSKRDTL